MKNTKVDQLKKKLMELSNIFRARQGVLDAERKVRYAPNAPLINYELMLIYPDV